MNKEAIQSQGYVWLFRPGHSHATLGGPNRPGLYVKRGVINWEEANGKLFPEGMEPHHANGIKLDDSPSNIVPMTHAEHARLEMHKRYNYTFDADIAAELYAIKGTGLRGIAKVFGIVHSTVIRLFKEAGIPLKTKRQQALERSGRV